MLDQSALPLRTALLDSGRLEHIGQKHISSTFDAGYVGILSSAWFWDHANHMLPLPARTMDEVSLASTHVSVSAQKNSF